LYQLNEHIGKAGNRGELMNIGITGGSGFIGRYIIEALLAKGISQKIKNIDLEKARFEGPFEFIQGDIRDKEKIDLFCKDTDCVIHLAAAHHDFGVADEEYFDVNENGTENLLAAMEKYRVSKLIFYSSVAVYGTKNLPADEDTFPRPENPYGASKLAAEALIEKWASAQPDRKAFVIRPTVVIGPRNEANMFFLIDQIYKGRYLFNFGIGQNIKSMANVKNLTDFTLDLLQTGFSNDLQYEVFNYVDYPQLKSGESINIIHEELGRKAPKVTLPLSLAAAIGKIFDLAILISGKNLPISSARIRKIATTTHFETNKIRKNEMILKRSVENGIREMVQWYLEVYSDK
jgi:nucleoside-diphosphate-sugar epimerase